MKLATFKHGSSQRVGVVADDEIVDLTLAAPTLPVTLAELLAVGAEALAAAEMAARSGVARLPLSAVKLLAPIPRPPKFFAIGLNFTTTTSRRPGASFRKSELTVFAKMSNCVVGPIRRY